ncbi:MAG: hypothetical protein NC081_02905 [Roseburia sp.]|nr:hypothetical protein [Roseburia sp.]
MSKSLGNYIGIYEDANTMFCKVMEIPDALMIKYFELAMDMMPEELKLMKEKLAQGGVQVNGKRARELTDAVKSGDTLKIGKKRFVRLEAL